MPDAINQKPSDGLMWLNYDQLRSFSMRLGISWDLMVDLYSEVRIGLSERYLVVEIASVEEIFQLGDAGLKKWTTEVGSGGPIIMSALLSDVREAAGE